MRYLMPVLFALLAVPAFAQTAATPVPAPAPATPQAAPQTTPQTAVPIVDLKALGRPVDDDTKSMMDRYVYFDDATVDPRVSLAKPVLTNAEISDWAKNNLSEIMTLDGIRFNSQIATIQRLFTPNGFRDYSVYLQQANIEKFLKDNQLKMVSYIENTPEITDSGLEQDKEKKNPPYYYWSIKALAIISYLDYKNQAPLSLFPDPKAPNVNRFPVNIEMDLVRIPMRKDGTLVAIGNIRFLK